MPNRINYLVEEYARQVRQFFRDDLKQVIVFGSYARGDYNEHSDIDIMLLVNLNDEQIHEKFYDVCDLAFDFEMEYGVVISPIIKNANHFSKWSDTLPFYRNVNREGVLVHISKVKDILRHCHAVLIAWRCPFI